MGTQPLISVVVIGRNEGQRLIDCLHSVNSMSNPGGPVELIYVDSNSSDQSVERAKEAGALAARIEPERPCAAVGRNVGWRQARAPFVLFLDGDTLLEKDFVLHALTAMEDPRVAVVWGHRRERYPLHSIYNRVLDLDWVYPPGETEFCGGDALMRRQVLESAGGFSDDLIAGEEPELCQRIRTKGYSILHLDVPMTQHDLAMNSWSAYWRRATRAGYAYAEVSQRLINGPFPLWRKESLRNLRHALVLFAVGVGALVYSVILGNSWPLLLALIFYLVIILRSAYKARWKSPNLTTLTLYGVHSHLQQIPIAWGQLNYWLHRFRKRKRDLIEYK